MSETWGRYMLARAVPLLFSYGAGGGGPRADHLLLDPMSVIAVLAMNAYKPVGTKLSVADGRVTLNDASFFQGPIRSFYGDTKAHIKTLQMSIIEACRRFARGYGEGIDMEDMAFVFRKAREGLENLRHTYKEDREIRACLNFYVNMIQAVLEPEALITPPAVLGPRALDDVVLPVASSSGTGGQKRRGGAASGTPSPMVSPVTGSSVAPSAGPPPLALHTTTTTSQMVLDIIIRMQTGGEDETHMKHLIADELHAHWTKHRLRLVIHLLYDMEDATPSQLGELFQAMHHVLLSVHEMTIKVMDRLVEIKV